MALEKNTFVVGVNACTVYPITVDTVTTYTVGTGVDIPIKSFAFDYDITETELKANEITLDVFTKIEKLTFDIDYAKMDLDLMSALLGGNTAASGTTPNQIQKYGLKFDKIDKYVQIAVKIDYVDKTGTKINDVHIHIMKAKISGNSFSSSTGAYGELKLKGTGVNTVHPFVNGSVTEEKGLYIALEETATALSAITA